MLEFLKTINADYGNLLTFLAALILIGVTIYYAIATHRQAKASIEQANASSAIVQDAKDRANRELEYFNSVKTNYIFQINAEMLFNSNFYVDALYYCLLPQKSQKNNVIKLFIEYLDDALWILISTEAAKYLPQFIMEDIVGYYTSLKNIKHHWTEGSPLTYLLLNGIPNRAPHLDFRRSNKH